MIFDRFDICHAWQVYATLWHGGQFTDDYRILGRLSRLGFRSGAGVEGPEGLTENGREIYLALVRKRQGEDAYLDECATLARP